VASYRPQPVGGSAMSLLLRGGQVHTMDGARTVASAVAIRDGKIIAFGDDATVDRYRVSDTEVIDLAGRMVLPGFIDAHIHPVLGALEYGKCTLKEVPPVPEQIISAIRAYVADKGAGGPDDWIEAVQASVSGLVLTKADLDRVSSAQPV